jgi:hypothetical protein
MRDKHKEVLEAMKVRNDAQAWGKRYPASLGDADLLGLITRLMLKVEDLQNEVMSLDPGWRCE